MSNSQTFDKVVKVKQRIQKLLAQRGFGSRRFIEKQISQGLITVNGKPATLGQLIDENDRLMIAGKPVYFTQQPASIRLPRLLIYYKPEGEICTRYDPEGRPTVFRNLPTLRSNRWVAVGRLDINTSGLLLFTNNGDLANKLMHPRFGWEREYAVRILGEVKSSDLKALQEGVMLEDGIGKFEKIYYKGGGNANHWYHVIVKEGRNRLVRRLWQACGLTISRLMRVRYGPIHLKRGMRVGKFYEVPKEEVKKLLAYDEQ